MAHTYHAAMSWDGEAEVWYIADSDFPGLVAEAPTQKELVDKIRLLVPELFETNRHLFDDSVGETLPLQLTSSQLPSTDPGTPRSWHRRVCQAF